MNRRLIGNIIGKTPNKIVAFPHKLELKIRRRSCNEKKRHLFLRQQVQKLAFELQVRGLMNVQFAVKDNEVYLIEVNPRAARTVP
ncbi:hypothetical protein MJL22_27020, partial [Salmonella enterica subsp. enterica serovar Montevideo]|nr:hypothetical protein [Salmonella enterica subsp. enterica serovar Montevideo]